MKYNDGLGPIANIKDIPFYLVKISQLVTLITLSRFSQQ